MTKVLGIVPYPEMKELMLSVASTRDDIELDVSVGDYRDCIRILEENLNHNYEVILSRGGTATELARRIHYIPVIEIPVSAFDLIAAVSLARASGAKFAAVVFPAIAADFQKLKELTKEEFPVYCVSSEEETVTVLEELKSENYGMVLCSAVTYEHALLLGLPSILITSGRDCIVQAFDQAVLLAGYYQKMHEKLYFYKNILRSHDQQTMILGEDGQILFTTESYPLSEELCEKSKKELSLAKKYGKCSFYKVLEETQYSVNCEQETFNGKPCFVLMFTRTKIPVKIDRHGISYAGPTAIRADLAQVSLLTLLNESDLANLNALCHSDYPVLITGEPNCYKSVVAKYLYLTGPLKARPLILIDCAALDVTGWQFLMTNDHSPLSESDCTVLIKNLAALDETKRMGFLNYIQANLFCKRNRVLFVHTRTDDPALITYISQLAQKTYCQVFEVPPLRDRLAKLDTYLSVYLNRKNQAKGTQVIEIEPEARLAFRAYHWPYNYKQLERVLDRLYDSSVNGRITLQATETILQEEKILEDTGKTALTSPGSTGKPSIDLSGSLEEITRNIVMQVLDECGGNQRAAARRLKISRTTLWRMLKE
ncbi:MAG: PrpR N-terminal domain-containing protein [Lachnospiraceae bacterium]|nr:PrpR N-terminal domain-containing protein [Lachnospiraceae bacterium]